MTKVYRKYRGTTVIKVIVDGIQVVPEFTRNGNFFDFSTSDENLQEALEKSEDFRKLFHLVQTSRPEVLERISRLPFSPELKIKNEALEAENERLKAENERIGRLADALISRLANPLNPPQGETCGIGEAEGGKQKAEGIESENDGNSEAETPILPQDGLGDKKDNEDENVEDDSVTVEEAVEEESTEEEADASGTEHVTVEDVKTLQEARAYLKSKGIAIASTSKTETVLATAEANKIRFPNLK